MTALPPRRQWSSIIRLSGLIENQTISPEQARRIAATSGSSALSTAAPFFGTASTTTCLTRARSSTVSIPRNPR